MLKDFGKVTYNKGWKMTHLLEHEDLWLFLDIHIKSQVMWPLLWLPALAEARWKDPQSYVGSVTEITKACALQGS